MCTLQLCYWNIVTDIIFAPLQIFVRKLRLETFNFNQRWAFFYYYSFLDTE